MPWQIADVALVVRSVSRDRNSGLREPSASCDSPLSLYTPRLVISRHDAEVHFNAHKGCTRPWNVERYTVASLATRSASMRHWAKATVDCTKQTDVYKCDSHEAASSQHRHARDTQRACACTSMRCICAHTFAFAVRATAVCNRLRAGLVPRRWIRTYARKLFQVVEWACMRRMPAEPF